MKKNVLLTSFGGSLSWDFHQDFISRGDYQVLIGDSNPHAPARAYTSDFVHLPLGRDDGFAKELLRLAQEKDIRMIIPGSDEEVFALMPMAHEFKKHGMILAVPPLEYLPYLQSKSAMYDFLKTKDVPVPFYCTFRTHEEFEQVLKKTGYPRKPLLIKPNMSRGGRGIILLSEIPVVNKDSLTLYNRRFFETLINEKTEFMAMEYLQGDIYDMDILTYQEGKHFINSRKRMVNTAKPFYGNIFKTHESLMEAALSIYHALPTPFLIDYDLILLESNEVALLEINPRPSGSTISYLPFGINLYHIMIKSYLDGENIDIGNAFSGQTVYSFHKMIKDS